VRSTLAALAAVALSLAASASADAPGGSDATGGETSTFAHAQVGSLSVVSGVIVTRAAADMRGVWSDEHVSCRTTRLLTVKILIDHVPSGKRFARSGRFKDTNCAEGGPNVGFTITARQAGLACPNGAWKPGRYDFVTTTIEPTKKLLATASLLWTNSKPC
jgi:hypothetical protein